MRAPALLRTNRDFRLLWIGESVSELGTTVTYVALPFVALIVLHATTFEVAALAAVETIFWPFIALPIGVWVDRVSRRWVLLMADSGRALALVSIPIAAALGDLTLVQLYVVGVVAGVLTIFFSVAYPSYLQSVVTKDELVEGNSLLTGAEQVAHISGPALGGVLVQALGAAYALFADVASFVVSVVAVFAIRAEEPPPVTERLKMRHEVVEGVRFLMDHKVLRAFIVAAATSNLFAGGAQAITVLFLVRVVHVQAGVVGLLLSVGALGGLLGAVLARKLIRLFGDGRTMVLATVVGRLLRAGDGAGLAPRTLLRRSSDRQRRHRDVQCRGQQLSAGDRAGSADGTGHFREPDGDVGRVADRSIWRRRTGREPRRTAGVVGSRRRVVYRPTVADRRRVLDHSDVAT
jgi:MFS family permease